MSDPHITRRFVDFRRPRPRGPETVWSKTGQALGTVIVLAAVFQFTPGLNELRWMPEDLWTLAPKLLRPSPPEAETQVAVVEDLTQDLDEDALMALGEVDGLAELDEPPPLPDLSIPDAQVVDAAPPDLAVDAQVVDVPIPDVAVDAPIPDVAVDAQVPDAQVVDAYVPDAAVPDVMPDAAIPDAAVPDAAIPDAAIPDAAIPDVEVPDSRPDAVQPDAAEQDSALMFATAPQVGQVFDSQAELPPHPARQSTVSGLPLLPIEDPQGSLRRFYHSLSRVHARTPGSVTRIVHYGDSLIASDYVTRTVRHLLQKKFGDGGHGFFLAGRPSQWYQRENLRLAPGQNWRGYKITRPTTKDGLYGLGGASFRARGAGKWVKAAPSGEGLGELVARMQVFYQAQPTGGRFEMSAGEHRIEVNTKAEKAGSRVAEILLPEGPHTFKVKTLGGGEVNLFGMVFERTGPGVVYDSLGIDGSRAKLLKRINVPHWHEQLRLRRPDLLILHYGTNESQWTNLDSENYYQDLSQTVGTIRQALPGVSCMLISPLDRAHRANGKLETRPVVKRIVAVQRRVAYAQGCAWWNTYLAMGGEGSMGRWYQARPQLAGGDLTHPTKRGAERIGAMFYAALMHGYAKYRSAQ